MRAGRLPGRLALAEVADPSRRGPGEHVAARARVRGVGGHGTRPLRRLRGRGGQGQRAQGERDGVGRPQPAQDGRALGHRGVRVRAPAGAGGRREHDHGQQPPEPEPEPDQQPELRVAERHADPGQRPHGEGEDERGEAEPEQDAVEPGRQRHRQHAPPRLRHLAAHLRHDPRPAGLAHGGRERDRGGDRGSCRAARAERVAERRQPAERDRPAGERAGREGQARRHRRGHPAGVAVRRQRVDHREAAGRPRAGQPGDDRGGDEHRV
jgi:hypothetical protein